MYFKLQGVDNFFTILFILTYNVSNQFDNFLFRLLHEREGRNHFAKTQSRRAHHNLNDRYARMAPIATALFKLISLLALAIVCL